MAAITASCLATSGPTEAPARCPHPSTLLQGIIMTDGPEWTSQRRFALKHLKDFGFGRSGLEGVIQGEVEDLVTLLTSHSGKDFKMETVSGILGMVTALSRCLVSQ